MENVGDEISAIDKVLAVAAYIETGVKEAFGKEELTQWEEEFISEMVDRIITMTDALGKDGALIEDAACFTEKQIETIDIIWNKAGQPDLED